MKANEIVLDAINSILRLRAANESNLAMLSQVTDNVCVGVPSPDDCELMELLTQLNGLLNRLDE